MESIDRSDQILIITSHKKFAFSTTKPEFLNSYYKLSLIFCRFCLGDSGEFLVHKYFNFSKLEYL